MFCGYVELLRASLPRSAILLFGNRARGDALPYSDYDVMIVVEGEEAVGAALEVAVRLKPRELPVDLLVVGLGGLRDPVRAKMLEDGCLLLYDGLGLGGGLPCRSGPCR